MTIYILNNDVSFRKKFNDEALLRDLVLNRVEFS